MKPRPSDPPLLDVQVHIVRPLGAREGWHVEVRPEALEPEAIAAAIDKAFADLRGKVREVLG